MTASLTEPVARILRPTPRPASSQVEGRPPWLAALDLAAVLLFAIEGALLGITAGVGVIGVLTIGFVASLGGGVVRDLLCHDTPPAALRSVAYPTTAFLGGIVAIAGYHVLTAAPLEVRAPLDAAALGWFCVAGAMKALDCRMRSLAAVLLGAMSAVGGGLIRDVLLGAVPAVLRSDVSAVAALCGAGVTVVALRWGVSRGAAATFGVASCLAISLLSMTLGWHLPRVVG
ncbi:MAG TPA: TRIC cation channel family protein [Pseudonocardia sp.]